MFPHPLLITITITVTIAITFTFKIPITRSITSTIILPNPRLCLYNSNKSVIYIPVEFYYISFFI